MRVVKPGLVVFCVALVASLCVHLPVYTVLGVLADTLLQKSTSEESRQVEFELAALTDPVPAVDDEESTKEQESQRPIDRPEPPQEPPEAKPKPPEPTKQEPSPPQPKQKPQLLPKPVPPQVKPPPPDKIDNRLAVTQKSENPDQPPPENARFAAEENRTVTEESVASITNLTNDDPEPSSHPHQSHESDAPGDSDRDELADLQNVRGEDTRPPDAEEAKTRPLSPSDLGQGTREAPAVTSAPQAGQSRASEETKRELAAGSRELGGEEEVIVIDDGMGRIRVRRSLPGRGPQDDGGEMRRGARADGRVDRAGARARTGANLSLSWSQFEQTFGAEELRVQRDAYLEQKRSQARGGSNEAEWKKFRAAIENFVTNVKPGNQTALNTAASPFAGYLAEVHRRIHREFALRFLRSISAVSDAYSDYSMYTRLEIIINQDGSLHQVGVVRTSGFLPFDYGAWNSVVRAAPYPEPPKKILSGDGRVYVHWDFHRNERQCGTFNAQPFILPNPPGTPKPGPGPLRDRGEDGPAGEEGNRLKFGARPAPLVPGSLATKSRQ